MITQKHELYGVEKHMSAIIVENLTFSYPGSYDNIFENTSFQLDTSWKLGLVGRNGRGSLWSNYCATTKQKRLL